MLLRAQGITKRYGRNTVLEDADFTVQEGEVLGLIGPNGAGKTTLFECLAGLLPTDGGRVEFGGKPLPAGRRKQALFYLPDGIRPWADQPVHWALAFFEALYGRKRGEGAALATELKLENLLKSRIGSLSKGEAKRVLLALGLLTPQPLLLLDEPFDGLDFRQTRDVMALLRTVPASRPHAIRLDPPTGRCRPHVRPPGAARAAAGGGRGHAGRVAHASRPGRPWRGARGGLPCAHVASAGWWQKNSAS